MKRRMTWFSIAFVCGCGSDRDGTGGDARGDANGDASGEVSGDASGDGADAADDGADRDGADRDGADRDGADRDGADRDGADADAGDSADGFDCNAVVLPIDPCGICTCDPVTGVTCTARAVGSLCDDGDCCTDNERCRACTAGTPSCTEIGLACLGNDTPCGDDNLCTDDVCACDADQHASCAHVPVVDLTDCVVDENACTDGDACIDGACVQGAPADLDDDNPCTRDRCVKGEVAHEAVTGGQCDDGNACTTADACSLGVCVGGPLVECVVPACASSASCVPGEGCVTVWAPDGTACDDGDPCTGGDQCDAAHACHGGARAPIDDGNPCTVDACDPRTGEATHTFAAGACDDGDPCTTGDTCHATLGCKGNALDCSGVGACMARQCNPDTGRCDLPLADGTACSDGDACTEGDRCIAGRCDSGAAASCDDANPCTSDTCDPARGCRHANNAATCDDGNACTTVDRCNGGACLGSVAPACDDGNACTDDTCNTVSGCVHANNLVACSDANACTVGDRCKDGACAAGKVTTCADDNACTDDACDPARGCTFTPNAAACDDGDVCTTGDHCADGACTGGGAPGCDDGNACTDDVCDPVAGCRHSNNSASCNDRNACTTTDRCSGGRCVGSGARVCNDGKACTDDACVPAIGCVTTNNTAPCSDADLCTTGDVCSGGECHGTAVDCSDVTDPCTQATCNPATGACDLPEDDGTACEHIRCGNGVAEADEACDDGNTDDGDTCSGDCTTFYGWWDHGGYEISRGAVNACDSMGGTCNTVCQCNAAHVGHTCQYCWYGDCRQWECKVTTERYCEVPGLGPCTAAPCTGTCSGGVCSGVGDICLPECDGAGCDDGNACTSGDTCASGVCAGTSDCPDDGDPCTSLPACGDDGGCGDPLWTCTTVTAGTIAFEAMPALGADGLFITGGRTVPVGAGGFGDIRRVGRSYALHSYDLSIAWGPLANHDACATNNGVPNPAIDDGLGRYFVQGDWNDGTPINAIGDGCASIFAKNVGDGSDVWSTQPGGPHPRHPIALSATHAYYGGYYGNDIREFDLVDGSIDATMNLSVGQTEGGVLVLMANDDMIATQWSHKVQRFTAAGSSLWSSTALLYELWPTAGDAIVGWMPAIGAWTGTGDKLVYVDASDGQPVWDFDVVHGNGPILTDADGAMYFGEDAAVTSVDASGVARWTTPLPVRVTAQFLGDDGRFYARSDTALYAIDMADGAIAWRYDVAAGSATIEGTTQPNRFAGTAALLAGGDIFLSDYLGNTYRFATDGLGYAAGAWARPRADRRNTARQGQASPMPPAESALCAALADGFEGYALGDVSGQDGWSGDATWDVVSSPVRTGSRALFAQAPFGVGVFEIEKAFAATSAATIRFWLRRSSVNNHSKVRFLDGADLAGSIDLNGNPDEFIWYASNTEYMTGFAISYGNWQALDVQLDLGGQGARLRVDGGAWSAWRPTSGRTKVDRIRLRVEDTDGDLYVDDVHCIPSEAP